MLYSSKPPEICLFRSKRRFFPPEDAVLGLKLLDPDLRRREVKTDSYVNHCNSKMGIKVVIDQPQYNNSDFLSQIQLSLLGFRINGTQTYFPTGIGYLHGDESQNGDWLYEAFKEPKSAKHPQRMTVLFIAKYEGNPIGKKYKIDVVPVFDYLVNYHKHGRDLLPCGGPYHAASQEDYDDAWRYARWKYNIDTSNLRQISYDANLNGYGLTRANKKTTLGDSAFSSENTCASTLGHENVHGGQPLDYFFPWIPEQTAEYAPYQWEKDHASQTGLSPEEIAHVQGWINYCLGVGPKPTD